MDRQLKSVPLISVLRGKPDGSSRSSAFFRRRPASHGGGFEEWRGLCEMKLSAWTSENPEPLDRIFFGKRIVNEESSDDG